MQIKIIIGLVLALGVLGWFSVYQTKQLGAAQLALDLSEQTVRTLEANAAHLAQVLEANAVENDRINLELSNYRNGWGEIRNEVSKVDACINASEPVDVIKQLRQRGD